MSSEATPKIKHDFFPSGDYCSPEPLKVRKFYGRLHFYLDFFSYLKRTIIYKKYEVGSDLLWCSKSYEYIKHLETYGARFHAEGLDNIGKGPYVFTCNHMSPLEVFLLPLFIYPLKTTYVLKKELMNFPGIKDLIATLPPPITVTRKNAWQDLSDVLEQGKAALENNCSVIIFPQGTRQSFFDPASFNSLGVKLARHAGVSCLPVALKTDFWGLGKLIKDFGPPHPERPVRFSFSPPLKPEGKGRQAQKDCIDFICSKMREWGIALHA